MYHICVADGPKPSVLGLVRIEVGASTFLSSCQHVHTLNRTEAHFGFGRNNWSDWSFEHAFRWFVSYVQKDAVQTLRPFPQLFYLNHEILRYATTEVKKKTHDVYTCTRIHEKYWDQCDAAIDVSMLSRKRLAWSQTWNQINNTFSL